MTRRLLAAVMAALFIFGAIAAPAPARASATQAPIAAEPFDSLTIRFAYNTTVGTALSDDGKTREIQLRPGQDAETALAAWEQAPGVVGVIPDIRALPLIDPIDPYYASQWDMHAPTTGKEGAANVAPTWGTSTGAGVVVAVIDTGQTNHPDLIANMPDGWGVDMIENSGTARDGDGRDMNPTDEGDWAWYPSTWHGTHVAGTIGAAQNEIGISGIAPNVSIQHVRVLGAGGGSFNDVIDGIRWAAGLTTSWDGRPWSAFGLTDNVHPADVINMSLGGGSSCWSTLQDAISQARAAGTVVVTAAGNSFRDAANFTPANCNDTVTVAATGRVGGLANYSNFGSIIDIAAPGGDMSRDSGILSTIGTGASTLTGYSYTNYQGTSMAAPHVAGVAALVASLHPTWGPSQIEAAIYAGARPFPADTLRPCVTTSETPTGSQHQCGVGLLDAVGALNMGQPTIAITAPDRMAVGESATVSAASDFSGVVTLELASESATNCTLAGSTLTATSTGTCALNAATPAAEDHVAASASVNITITGTPQTISFGAGPLLTAADVPYGTAPPVLTASASSGLSVSYEISTPTVCEALAPPSPSETWGLRLLNVGTCTVLATQAGDAVYERATSIERSFTIVQGSQTIGLDALSDRSFDPTAAQLLPRFSSAGLPISYSGLSSSVCEPQFNGANFELKVFRPGTCTILAEQAGTSTYRAADSVTRTFEVFRLTQTPLIFQVGPAYQSVGSTGSYGNGGGSTMAPFVATSLTRTVCTVSGRTIRYLKVGTCILQGFKDGNEWHQPAYATVRITVFAPARATAQPRINQIGNIVSGTRGTWVGGPTPSFKYQWYICSAAPRTSCAAIKGATSTKLTVTSKIAGKYAFLRVFMYQAGYERARTDSNVIKLSAK
ncbi:MAG: S8 family peptidase [Chloroflexi bacterium]|nr:S8 family peptidase [Chloroflexota bacterium]